MCILIGVSEKPGAAHSPINQACSIAFIQSRAQQPQNLTYLKEAEISCSSPYSQTQSESWPLSAAKTDSLAYR